METKPKYDIVLIGGSSGSLPLVIKLLYVLPEQLNASIVVIIHRMKNVKSELDHILSARNNVCEPDDKDLIEPGKVYLAPQNYHLLIETDKTFSLDYSELVNYSRPSIDVSFSSAAEIYGPRTMGILLSGANSDGAEGLRSIIEHGGKAIVQDPATCEFPKMTTAAIEINNTVTIQKPEEIVYTILNL